MKPLNWIKVSEETPIDDTPMLCYGYQHPVFIARYDGLYFVDKEANRRNVTHWAHLLEPPQD